MNDHRIIKKQGGYSLQVMSSLNYDWYTLIERTSLERLKQIAWVLFGIDTKALPIVKEQE